MSSQNTYPSKPMKKLILRGGRVFDPQVSLDQKADILIDNGQIQEIGKITDSNKDIASIDCTDKVIVPGLIDMHVHLREPGREDKETIASGTAAAMAGGFTAVCCMPNTHPPIDNRGQVEFINERASGLLVDVYPIGAVTKGQKGEQLTEMGDMLDAGAVAFSDDGLPMKDSGILRRALEYLSMFDRPLINHCEDLDLSEDGVMNEGFTSTFLGMRGIPNISEEIHVARDIMTAAYTKGKLHIAHVSTQGSVQLIREAKKRGVRITAETCPHYFVLNDDAVRSFDTNTKMKPPLRTEADRLAIIAGLKDGTLDVIATDHAPHTVVEKDTEFDAAAFGIVGLETAVGLVLTHLLDKEVITLKDIVQKMSINPRKILRLDEVKIEKKYAANLSIFDLNASWKVDKTRFFSKSKNTPFDGWQMKGSGFGVYNNSQLFLNKAGTP